MSEKIGLFDALPLGPAYRRPRAFKPLTWVEFEEGRPMTEQSPLEARRAAVVQAAKEFVQANQRMWDAGARIRGNNAKETLDMLHTRDSLIGAVAALLELEAGDGQ